MPIKENFKKNAEAALLTLRAQGSADDSNVICNVATPRGTAIAGIHPKCGGSGKELCSGDMLLEALVACAGISLKAAAAVLDIPVKAATVSAEGDVDLRGTLGVSADVPVGFNEIRLTLRHRQHCVKSRTRPVAHGHRAVLRDFPDAAE